MDPLLKWRSAFPILEKKRGYLVNNSLGAMPKKVYERLHAFADAWANDGVLAWHDWVPQVVQTGNLLAPLIGAPPGSVMMQTNVAQITHMILSCFDWRAPRNKIVATDLNFPSVPYNFFATRGAETVLAHGDGVTVDPQRIIDLIDERTALVSLDLVLFRSSAIVNVKPVIERAHAVGARVVVDGYQATGAIPIDVTALDCDFFMGGSVKWLCGGPGAGYLYVKPSILTELQPSAVGWWSHKEPFDFEVGEIDYATDIHRFMAGSPGVPALYSASAGYEIINEVGVAAIREKSLRLTQLCIDLADEQGLTVNSPRAPHERGGTVCVDFPGSEAAHHQLIERGFIVDWRPGCGIRISPHFYNSEDELRGAMAELAQLRGA